jgi:photosystem II stability/assembly factor-like uncharacterized protein
LFLAFRPLASGLCSVVVAVLFTIRSTPARAAPKTGPDRPFTVQWRVASPVAPDLNSVAFDAPHSLGIAVGEFGAIFRSDDGGRTWMSATTPPSQNSELHAVAIVGANAVLAIGDGGTILLSVDQGRSWRAAGTPPDFKADLLAMGFADGQSGVATGTNEGMLRTDDSGKTWHKVTIPNATSSRLQVVGFARDGIGIAAGGSGVVLRTADGGKTWDRIQTPAEFEVSPKAVVLSSKTTAYLGGVCPPPTSETGCSTLWQTNDGGGSWTAAPMPPGQAVKVSSIASDGEYALAGGIGFHVLRMENTEAATRFGGAILWTHDRGRHWSLAKIEPGCQDVVSVAFKTANDALGVCSEGALIKTRDGGQTWTPFSKANSPLTLKAASIAGNGQVIAVGESSVVLSAPAPGQPWSVGTLPAGFERSLSAVIVSRTGRAIAIGSVGGIIFSRDSGATWSSARTPTAVARLAHAAFVDDNAAIAIGASGTILRTTDGGQSWSQSSVPDAVKANLTALSKTGTKDLVAVGDDGIILYSGDSGATWSAPNIPLPGGVTLNGVTSSSRGQVLVVGSRGTLLYSENFGRTWTVRHLPPGITSSINGAAFAGDGAVVVAGDNGVVLRSTDSGKQWLEPTILPDKTNKDLRLIQFADESHGILAEDGLNDSQLGFIYWTENGGKAWQRAKMPSDLHRVVLHALTLTGSGAGVALGSTEPHERYNWDVRHSYFLSRPLLLTTRDFGKSWTRVSNTPESRGSLIDSAFGPDPSVAVIIGERGLRLASGSVDYAPYVKRPDESVRERVDGQLELDLETADDEGDAVQGARVEYNIVRKGRDAEWLPVPIPLSRSTTDGHWRGSWAPSDEAIGEGAQIQHRVFLDDGGPPLPSIALNATHYRSFWTRLWTDYRKFSLSLGGAAALVLLYVGPVLLSLAFAPVRLAIASSTSLEAFEGSSKLTKVLGALLRTLTLPWFKRRARVRRAWLKAYADGRVQFAKLDKTVRASFLEHDDVLDAWVARQLGKAVQALDQLPIYRSRRTYIESPIRVGDVETGRVFDKPDATTFQSAFGGDRTIIAIVGAGGTGKTTIACALARWSMSPDPKVWPAGHPAIPVIVGDDTVDLTATVTGELRKMLGRSDGELDPDVVTSLLKRRRVLVIVDALSERSATTQQHVVAQYGADSPINALVVTTRRHPQFGAVERTLVCPQPIDLTTLVPFILEYLRRRELTVLFSARQQLSLAERILELVENSGNVALTPLLITLYVEAATIGLASGSLDDLPLDVPEIYLHYVERLNPVAATAPQSFDLATVLQATQAAARTSLGDDYVPTDFKRSELEKSLEKAGLTSVQEVVNRLIANNLVVERSVAGLAILRFQLDPVAECLAAIDVIHTLGRDPVAWEEFVSTMKGKAGYPDAMRGFLQALEVSWRKYREPLHLPDVRWGDRTS